MLFGILGDIMKEFDDRRVGENDIEGLLFKAIYLIHVLDEMGVDRDDMWINSSTISFRIIDVLKSRIRAEEIRNERKD